MLTDRQRVELALPARLMFNAAVSASPDGSNAECLSIIQDLKIACNQPVDGLVERERRKVARRIERAALDLAQPFVGKCTAGKMAMLVFYFVEGLIEDGTLSLYEDSPMARATNRFAAMLEEKFAEEDMDRSAKKQGRKLREECRKMGLYG